MFKITKPPITLGSDLTLDSTNWYVYNTNIINDDNLVFSSLNDSENLLSIVLDLPLTDNDVYYVTNEYNLKDNDDNIITTNKARLIRVTNKIKNFTVNNTIIATPIININFKRDAGPIGNFIINANDFYLFTGVGNHVSTDYIIEDLNGKVIWSSIENKIELNTIRVPSCVMDLNRIYIIKVRYNTNTNISSNYGKVVIKTNDYIDNVSDCDTMFYANEYLTKLTATVIYETLNEG